MNQTEYEQSIDGFVHAIEHRIFRHLVGPDQRKAWRGAFMERLEEREEWINKTLKSRDAEVEATKARLADEQKQSRKSEGDESAKVAAAKASYNEKQEKQSRKSRKKGGGDESGSEEQ